MLLSKTWEIILTLIPAIIIASSGAMKLVKAKPIMESFKKIGMTPYANVLGTAEILFSVLFVYPPTNVIGFLLLICYFSGALAVDLSHKNKIVRPLTILVLVFVVEYMVNSEMFW
jgi:hypothetical protein